MTNQKKLLSIDGGGIRGIMALRVLNSIESILREQSGKPDLVLSDYFDYMAGTSTGGIIAAGLALGMSVAEMETFYRKEASLMFTLSKNPIKRWLYSRYDAIPLQDRLQQVFGKDTTMGSPKLKSLLMLVMLNATTNSPWPVSSNPKAKYNDKALGLENNHNLLLWQLVRASAAAPYFFDPEEVQVGSNKFLFYDGALSSLNNPAFKLFQMATLPSYRLEWPTGEDKLLLVSVGTGLLPKEVAKLRLRDKQIATTMMMAMQSLMFSGTAEVDLQCRSFSHVLAGDPIDGEVGDLIGMPPAGGQPLFSYLRYNALLTQKGLSNLGCSNLATCTFRLDDIAALEPSAEIGNVIASQQVKAEHFSNFPHVAKNS